MFSELWSQYQAASEIGRRSFFRKFLKGVRALKAGQLHLTWRIPVVTWNVAGFSRGLNGVVPNRRECFNPVVIEIDDIIEFPLSPRYLDRDLLHQKYVVERLSCEEIASEIQSARTTVLKYLKAYGIPVRPSGHNFNRKLGLSYGRRIQNRHQVFHKSELRTIEHMSNLRASGFSYWKIADVLNSMKVPTKTRKGLWMARTVQRVLENTSQ